MSAGNEGDLQQKPIPDGNNGGYYAPVELDAGNGTQYKPHHKYQ
jgi:hypothetical protein